MYCYLKNECDGHVCLGEGSSGIVKLAMDVPTKELVAIKTIYNRSATNELAIHKDLRHANIIRLIDFQVDTIHRNTTMIMEYADDGTLKEKIHERRLEKSQIKTIFRQICQAVKYLHSKCVIHGDLKPENILLNKSGKVKVSDFGSSSLFGLPTKNSGTLEYLSPEALLNIEQDEKGDVWALGILLFEMIAGEAPFVGATQEEMLSHMKQTIPFSEVFDLCEIDLIKRILRVGKNKRPNINEVLTHRYFSMFSDDKSVSASTVISQGNDDNSITLPVKKVRKISVQLENFQAQSKQLTRIRRQFRYQSEELTKEIAAEMERLLL